MNALELAIRRQVQRKLRETYKNVHLYHEEFTCIVDSRVHDIMEQIGIEAVNRMLDKHGHMKVFE